MTVTYTTAVKNARLSAIATAAGTSPLLRIYNGTPPATVNAALSSNTLLAQLAMASTPFGAPSSGTMTAGSIVDDSSADASGTPSFWRIVKSDGTTYIAQGSAGTSGTDLVLADATITSGAAVNVASLVITSGN